VRDSWAAIEVVEQEVVDAGDGLNVRDCGTVGAIETKKKKVDAADKIGSLGSAVEVQLDEIEDEAVGQEPKNEGHYKSG